MQGAYATRYHELTNGNAAAQEFAAKELAAAQMLASSGFKKK
jgi:hypothetical protein